MAPEMGRRTHPECLARLTLFASLLNLGTAHLLLKLALLDTTVVFKCEKDVQAG